MTEQTPSRKEQILQALAHMLEAEPGGRITTAGLAREVGVSEAALYRHFPSKAKICLLYTSPSPRDQRGSRMPSSA